MMLAATAAALTIMFATGAHAEGWCGFAAQAKSVIQCGYSSSAECENAVGKGGMCFIDPEYALDATRGAPRSASRPTAGRG
ncbi:MAG TPA: hypothetical protein VK430_00450 [Xanthobacteraceae bacterium]|nr:hypothetical protein [Xanthobacteraceae bacterium]